MTFDLPALLAERAGQGYELQDQYLKPHLSRMLHVIGFDKVYEKGEGGYLWDAEGNRYADFLTGFGVFAMGRNHPVIRKALHDLLDAELADLVQFDCALLPGLLAERLLAKAPGLDRAYFCNSGTEAVETALKFARYATGKRRILYCDHAFHGLTLGSLSVNGSAEFRKGFDPLLPDGRIAFGDLDALRAELRKGDVAALLVEPVQGKGVHVSPPGFLTAAANLLHEHDALLICDEIQSGLGRTGRFFAYQHDDVQPDIVTVAKALSGGFIPIGATLAKDWIFQKVYSSMDRMFVHDSTFGHNAPAMTAGLASLAVIEDEHLVENAERTGEALMAALSEMVDTYELFGEVRGRGLMIGMEFCRPKSLKLRAGWSALQAARHGLFAQMIVVFMFQRHRILTQVAADHDEVIKLLPTLTIGDTEIKLFCDAFADVMDDASRGSGLMWDFGRTLIKQAIKR
jgi:acetylornithine/succinyldiaminopimelate/putrescine aminotransferase